MRSDRRRISVWLGLALSAGVGGCSTTNYSQTESLSCIELNSAVAETADTISRTGIVRGRIMRFPLPGFLSRGEGAKQALADRQGRKIDETRSDQGLILAERRRRCLDRP